jgi:hypothetical protein
MMTVTVRSKLTPVGEGFAVEFVFDGQRLDAEWSPGLPGPNRQHLIPAYRRARDRFLRRVAVALGTNIGVLEL